MTKKATRRRRRDTRPRRGAADERPRRWRRRWAAAAAELAEAESSGASERDLRARIEPYRWTYTGRPLAT